MRVPTNALPTSLVSQLNQLNSRQVRLQNQAATGQKLQWADDDPAAMQRALELKSATRTNTQYQKNINFLDERLTTSLNAVRDIQKVVDRAGEIATLADGTRSPQELKAYATEVDQLIRQATQTANSKHRGDYLFGGTRSNHPPFELQENADKEVTGVIYQGNADTASLEIGPGTAIAPLPPGANPTGTGAQGLLQDLRTGADLFTHLITLRNHLAAGDTAAIAASDHANLQTDEESVIYQIANGGSAQARLTATATAAKAQNLELRQAFSKETDADLSETIVQLSATQTAYRAALQSGANLLNTSLMDFLR